MRTVARPLLYAGIVAIVFGASKYHASTVGGYDFTNSSRFAWAMAYIAVLGIAAYGLGLPDVPSTAKSRVTSAWAAAAVGALGMSLVQLVVGDALLPRFVVFGSALVLIPWYLFVAHLSALGRSSLEERDRVVVVGGPDLVAELEAELLERPERPASVVGSLTTAAAVGSGDGVDPLVAFMRDRAGTVLVLDSLAQLDDDVVRQAARLHETGVRVRTRSLFYEEWLGKLPIQDLGRVALFFDIGELHRARFGRLKRLFDIVSGTVGLVPLAVLVPVVAVGNLFANRGPLFYRQARVGWRGREFTILKFRTMLDDDVPTTWTSENDPRVTPWGRVLRTTHLDELPQVWNILRGDLSLVGPRPEQPRYVADLVEKLPFYDLRHSVRPGLTGWAQVKYGYAGDERDAIEKLQYDFHYLRRQSLVFDLRIVARTIRSVVGVQGAGR